MFRQTYKATIRNLFRSGLFWLIIAIFLGIVIYNAMNPFTGYSKTNPVTGAVKNVMDTSPEYVLGYDGYIQVIWNAVCAHVMYYALPCITVLSTVLILNRDYGDNFYEIEKSSGIRTTAYLLGRITALITVNFTLVIIASFIAFHSYIISRGGLSIMGTMYYITDSSIRLMRIIVLVAFPNILFYIGATYLLGCVFKSGLYSSILSMGYVMFYAFQGYYMKGLIPQSYIDYFSPLPQKLTRYLYWYDTFAAPKLSGSQQDATLAFLFQPAVFLITLITSYILIRKRNK